MNTKKFSDAMSELDSKYVDEAIKYQKEGKKSHWIKWSTMVACLCLVIAGVFTFGNLYSWKTGCSNTVHNITYVEGIMYYNYLDDGVYIYKKDNMTKEKLADFDGAFTQTTSGLYLLNRENGAVYSVSGNKLNKVASIVPNSTLIDVISSKIYYQTCSEEGIYTVAEMDLMSGATTEVLTLSDGHMKAQKIIGNKLYYYTVGNEGAIVTLDLESGENETIYTSSMEEVVFYDDFILIETGQGLFIMRYNDVEATFISKYIPTTSALDYYKNKLYFQVAFPAGEYEAYDEALISLDLQTKKISIVTQLTEGGMSKTYTEIVMCDDGYFYTEPSATAGGLFYHSFDGTPEITISKNK